MTKKGSIVAMLEIIKWVQIAVSVLLILVIILQQKGADIGGALGGQEGGVYFTRRGMEKYLFYATIVLAVIFAGSVVATIVLK